jgi:3-isopropylmalate dehydratase small subunit
MICTRKDFINIAGIASPSNLTTYIQRGKVVMDSDGNFDTDNVINKDFLAKRSSQGLGTTISESLTKTQPVEKIEVVKAPVSKKIKQAEDKTKISKWEVDLEKSKRDLILKDLDIELKNQKISIQAGNNIPVEYVKELLSQYSKNILHGYTSFLDQRFSDFCHQFRISNIDKAKLLSKNVDEINKIHKKITNDTKDHFRKILKKAKLKSVENDENDGMED